MVVVEIQRGQFARDLVTVAKIHLRTTCLFAAGRTQASQLLLAAYAENLQYFEIRETAFAEAMWFLYDYAQSSNPPSSLDLDQWTVSEAASTYLQMLDAAGSTALRRAEIEAVIRCLTVCERANTRFTINGSWLPFFRT